MALAGSTASAAVVPANVIATEDSAPAGATSPIANVYAPFVNAAGEVSFSGSLDSGEQFVFTDDTVVWLSSDEAETFTFISNDMGSSGAAQYVLRASIDGEIGLWTQDDALVVNGDPAPGFPAFPLAEFRFANEPSMDGNGTVYFRATVSDDGVGGSDLSGLYRAPNADPALIELLWGSGDTIDGVDLLDTTGAIREEYQFSDEATHYIASFVADSDFSIDRLLIVDDAIALREGDVVPSFMGEQWVVFEVLSINESGNYLFNGRTSAPAALDEFVGYNGDVQLHEGDVIDMRQLAFDLRFLSINDRNNALLGWAHNVLGSVVEIALFACDASDLPGTAHVLLEVGDSIDVDGDDIGDFDVTDIQGPANERHRGLGDADAVYIEVDLDPGDLNSIIEIPVSCCGNGITDGGEECDDANDDETDACLTTCVAASCGDGFIWDGVEDCDDGNDVDDDECPNDCLLPGGTTTGMTTTGVGSSSDGGSTSTGEPPMTTGEGSSSGGGDGSTSTSEGTGASTSGGASASTSTSTSTSTSMSTTTSTSMPTGGGETDTDSGGEQPSADGCGCSSRAGSGWGAGLFLVAFGVARRRRRRQPTPT